MPEPVPIFDLTDQFDTTLSIGDHELPVHIKRFSRAEMEAFEKAWDTYIVEPRGADAVAALRRRVELANRDGNVLLATIEAAALLALLDGQLSSPADAAAADSLDAATRRWMEAAIEDALTIAPGLMRDRGAWVTDGAGFLRVFHARRDVLVNAVLAIYAQNRLSSVIRKNSSSPRASEPGSAPSIPVRGGDGQGPTVPSAEPSTTAVSEAATDASAPAEDAPASSGAIRNVH